MIEIGPNLLYVIKLVVALVVVIAVIRAIVTGKI